LVDHDFKRAPVVFQGLDICMAVGDSWNDFRKKAEPSDSAFLLINFAYKLRNNIELMS
jgi:hypothetical protein